MKKLHSQIARDRNNLKYRKNVHSQGCSSHLNLKHPSWDMSVREWAVSPPSTHWHPHLPALGTGWYQPETMRGGSTLLSPPCTPPQPCLNNLSFPPPSPPSPSTASSGRLTGAFSPLLEVLSSLSEPHSLTSLSNLPETSGHSRFPLPSLPGQITKAPLSVRPPRLPRSSKTHKLMLWQP